MEYHRHCGDVLTRKTFTIDFREHKKAKNRGERAQSRYFNHHEAIISRDDFIAVQHMLDYAKYSRNGHSYLPTLKVITRGLLEEFIIVKSKYSFFNKTNNIMRKTHIIYYIIILL